MNNCKIFNLLTNIKSQIEEIEKLLSIEQSSMQEFCIPFIDLSPVDLTKGSIVEKTERMVNQITKYSINIIPTSKDSHLVRSALVAELGEVGLKYWLSIRKLRDDYDEASQVKKYSNLCKNRNKNTMTFGTIVNRYRDAINRYNEENNPYNTHTICITTKEA